MAKKSKSKKKGRSFPSKAEILEFIKNSDRKVGKREIARAFNIKGNDRTELKMLLRQMKNEGLISGNRKKIKRPGELPPVTVIEITGRDEDGEFVARPVVWDEDVDGPKPQILVLQSNRSPISGGVAGVGDRLLARIEKLPPEDDPDSNDDPGKKNTPGYLARPMRRLDRPQESLLGIFRSNSGDRGGIISPVDRKQMRDWVIDKGDTYDAKDGDLVRFEIKSRRRTGISTARVREVLGNPDDQKQISLIAIHSHGIPDVFPASVMDAVEELSEPDYTTREDLRDIPLITIDPSDARDHDDAVWAEADPSPDNKGGWVVIVAIADVAHYVRPGSVIDKHAQLRGNSTYFPDRVVPMLPERISNDLCSLRENEVRPCLAARMVFDRKGHKKSAVFLRGVMRSHARLSYREAQAAIDGDVSDRTRPIVDNVLKPLWGAYHALREARAKREPLDLDLPERKIIIGDDGRVEKIEVPERLDAHKLVEEFMIQANVAAAEVLEGKTAPFIYRVHDVPSQEKLLALRNFLRTLDLKFPTSGLLKPSHFNRILAETADSETADLVSEVVLRSQSQAEYSAAKAGHFGLNLVRYAHFTSPIRRYADLVVHRALIAALGFGNDGAQGISREELGEIASAISKTERRSMAAERETVDRLIAAHLAEHMGAKFQARISGVTRSGLFVRLSETGADGFIPISTLGDEYFLFQEERMMIVGEESRSGYRLGDDVEVRLVEVVQSAGALRFEMLSEGQKISGKLKRTPRGRGGGRKGSGGKSSFRGRRGRRR